MKITRRSFFAFLAALPFIDPLIERFFTPEEEYGIIHRIPPVRFDASLTKFDDSVFFTANQPFTEPMEFSLAALQSARQNMEDLIRMEQNGPNT